MALTTTRHAITQARKIAQDPKLDSDTKKHLVSTVMAPVAAKAQRTDQYGRLVYRVIAVALGSVAVLVVVLAFVLKLTNDSSIDAAFYALGSAAVGALGGVFAPTAARVRGQSIVDEAPGVGEQTKAQTVAKPPTSRGRPRAR